MLHFCPRNRRHHRSIALVMMNRISIVSFRCVDTMGLMVRAGSLAIVLGVFSGCTERVNVCNSDSDCTNPAYPFCDVNGEYAESGHVAMSCSITPASCPIERCGCVAGLVTCTGDQLTTCNADGNSITTETCALGCTSDGVRCSTFEPSNGLATQLTASASVPDVTLPDGATLNTDTGAVSGLPHSLESVTVSQGSGPDLRVFIAHSWKISNVRVLGSLPVAFVASGEITVNGTLDASADGQLAGPGASECEESGAGGPPGLGHYERPSPGNSGGYPEFIWCIGGGGGGGYGTAGGGGGEMTGSSPPVPGGIAGSANGVSTLVPLRGGCPGNASIVSNRGAGGGAVQLVSGDIVHLTSEGKIHVGGGGGNGGGLGDGNGPAGGGSGGGILIEAPSLVLDNDTALLAAGGGGGGYGACPTSPQGMDGPPAASIPAGGACPMSTNPAASGGVGATTGAGAVGANATDGSAGGGGGGLGRIRVNTADGMFTSGTGATIWGTLTTGTLEPR